MRTASSQTAVRGPQHCDIAVVDGFVLTEMAGVVDVLRLANRLSG
ncbi:MAG: transcriptional regulator GlxA family with amidase domain, partial [Reinekea sp.]